MRRREFMRAASGAVGGAAVAAGASGPAVAQEDDEEEENGEDTGNGADGEPDWGGALDDAGGYDKTTDLRGEDEVQVMVGAGDGFQYDPPAIWIDPGTTVTWEWTGDGGAHNVIEDDGVFESELVDEAGFTFEHTFEDEDIYTYVCTPHIDQGMIGGVAVGDVPTVDPAEAAAPGAVEYDEMGVDIQEHWVGVGAVLMLIVSLVFTFFALKYGESPHTSGGNR